MAVEYVVGRLIDSWCTKCKLILAHTIVALADDLPKKVRCNTCSGNHNYRAQTPAEKKPGTARKKKATEYEKMVSQLEDDYDFSHARKYEMGGIYKAEEIIDHSRFGIGFILSIINRHKFEIVFKEGTKRLVQNQQ